MFKSMFARLFRLFMSVILFALILMSVFSYFTIRDLRINSRMDELKKEAREIAYLASLTRDTAYPGAPVKYGAVFSFSQVPSANTLLQWKARQVYEEFRAYIVVVNRQNQILQNIQTVSQDDPDFAAALNMREIHTMLQSARMGKEMQTQTTFPGSNGPVFIVAVPWIEKDLVVGTVFIHTPAQVIQASYASLLHQVLMVTVIAAAISGFLVFWFVKRITRPLTGMAAAAARMSQEDFTVRAEPSAVPEIDEVAQAFNIMVERLAELETSRREFVANVSHELRSPITSIRGYIEGLRDGTIAKEETGKYLDTVSSETKRLSKLIADLLNLSHMEQSAFTLTPARFDINELIRRVLISFMNDIDRKQLQPDIRLPEEAIYVYADPDRIEQVIINLLDNAVKFSHEKGMITVETRDDGLEVEVTISDTGEGILPDDMEHIFERFYTADKAHTAGKGTGLGLSICKSILKLHGKAISAIPKQNGAAFRFTLSRGDDRP